MKKRKQGKEKRKMWKEEKYGKIEKISDEKINRKEKRGGKKKEKERTKMATKTRTTNHGLRRICKV